VPRKASVARLTDQPLAGVKLPGSCIDAGLLI